MEESSIVPQTVLRFICFTPKFFKMARYILLTALAILSINGTAQSVKIQDPLNYLALGDSYTIGESVTIFDRWPVQLSDAIQEEFNFDSVRVDIIARTGWTTTELLSGIMDQYDENIDYNLVSLLIGVNNQYRGYDIEGYEPEVRDLLDFALSVVDNDASRVFILSIPDYSFTPSHSNRTEVSGEIDAYNAVMQELARSYGITYIDVTAISRKGLDQPDLVAFDGLHPSGKQYAQWVNVVMRALTSSQSTSIQEENSESGSLNWKYDGSNLSLQLPKIGGMLGIYDTSGRLLKQERQYSDVAVLPVQNFTPGVYLVRYRLEETITSEKIYID